MFANINNLCYDIYSCMFIINRENNKLDFGEYNELYKFIRAGISNLIVNLEDGHSEDHIYRVFKYAMYIQSFEGGDKEVLAIAAFLHDLHRWIKNKTNEYISPMESIDYVKAVISPLKLDSGKEFLICEAVENHEYRVYNSIKNEFSIETRIIQDADNLDAVGAIGLIRTFKYGFAHGIPDYIADVPFEQSQIYKDNIDSSTMHHIYNKLMRIDRNLNTTTAKELSKDRMKIISLFFDEFLKEWRFYEG